MPAVPDTDIAKEPNQLLQDAGMMVFMDTVDNNSIKPIVEWILVENHVTKKKKKEPTILKVFCRRMK